MLHQDMRRACRRERPGWRTSPVSAGRTITTWSLLPTISGSCPPLHQKHQHGQHVDLLGIEPGPSQNMAGRMHPNPSTMSKPASPHPSQAPTRRFSSARRNAPAAQTLGRAPGPCDGQMGVSQLLLGELLLPKTDALDIHKSSAWNHGRSATQDDPRCCQCRLGARP